MNINKSSFFSDVLTLAGGTVFAQVLLVLATPIITRLYNPEAFGIIALFTAITGIIAVVACLRYELAIMLPKRDEEAANLFGLSLMIAAGVSTLTVLMIWLSGERLLQLLNAPELLTFMWLAPPVVFLGGATLALNYWSSRKKRFGRLSVARINASISTTSIQIGAGISGYPTGGSLIGASILGSAASTLILGGQIWRDDHRLFQNSISVEGMRFGLNRHRKFPLIDTLSALINSISWQLPIFILSIFFPTSIVGLYALCHRVLHLPMSFIGSSISQVFFQRAAEARAGGRLPYLVENVFNVLVLLGLFPMMMLTLMGRDLFVVIFGQTWSEAGVYAQILGVYTFLWFISSPLSTIYIVLEKQEFGLKINIANIITRFSAIGIGGLLDNPRISISLFAISGILVYTYLLLSVLRYSDVPISKALKIILSNLKIFAPFGTIIVVLKVLYIDPAIQVCMSAILVIIYYLFIVKTDPLVREALKKSTI